MILFIAGHGHAFEKRPDFVEWMKKHDVHFLVSFAYPDMGRLKFARRVRKEQRLAKKKGKKK